MHLRCCRIVRRRRCTGGSRSRAVVGTGGRPAVRQAGGTPCSKMCFPAARACAIRRFESNHSLASDESSWISDHPTVQSTCIRTFQTRLLQYYSCSLDRATEGSDSDWCRCTSGSAFGNVLHHLICGPPPTCWRPVSAPQRHCYPTAASAACGARPMRRRFWRHRSPSGLRAPGLHPCLQPVPRALPSAGQ